MRGEPWIGLDECDSSPVEGWQGLRDIAIVAERLLCCFAFCFRGLPLLTVQFTLDSGLCREKVRQPTNCTKLSFEDVASGAFIWFVGKLQLFEETVIFVGMSLREGLCLSSLGRQASALLRAQAAVACATFFV